MNFIYTYNSYDGKKLPTPFEKRMAMLSVASLTKNKQANDKIILYADFLAAQFFRDNNIHFDEINIIDFEVNNQKFWNTGKIEVYKRQQSRFLHIDFDTAFFPGFSVPEDAEIVTEQLRDYEFTPSIRYFGIHTLDVPKKLICSGLIGGNVEKPIWTELYYNLLTNKCHIERNYMLYDFEKLISLEEYALTQLAKKHNATIAELDKTYFAHWQGTNKQERFGKIINDLCEMYGI